MFPVGASHPSYIPIVESFTPVVSSYKVVMYTILTQLMSYLIGNLPSRNHTKAVITCSNELPRKARWENTHSNRTSLCPFDWVPHFLIHFARNGYKN